MATVFLHSIQAQKWHRRVSGPHAPFPLKLCSKLSLTHTFTICHSFMCNFNFLSQKLSAVIWISLESSRKAAKLQYSSQRVSRKARQGLSESSSSVYGPQSRMNPIMYIPSWSVVVHSSGAWPASVASTVNGAGLPFLTPLGSTPGPYTRTLLGLTSSTTRTWNGLPGNGNTTWELSSRLGCQVTVATLDNVQWSLS